MLSALIVDDNVALRLALARDLERRGWQVITAASGVQGLEAIRHQSFDVVISDVNMPGRGGVWLWENAVALRPELRGRFVLISSEPLPEPRSMGLFVGSEHFLLKPLSLATLWGEVQRIVETAGGKWPHAAWDPDLSTHALSDQPLDPPQWPPEALDTP
ncbi:MAG TPA: response regulator [Gemmatimonadales bacterium]|nr:response regulator [Gemmatimonadales bacterium]